MLQFHVGCDNFIAQFSPGSPIGSLAQLQGNAFVICATPVGAIK